MSNEERKPDMTREKYESLPLATLKELAKAIKEAKKLWGHLTIVEVHSSNGDEVTITL